MGQRASTPNRSKTQDSLLQQIAKASGRVGREATKAAEWLVKFIQLDLNRFTGRQWADLRDELIYLTVGTPDMWSDLPGRLQTSPLGFQKTRGFYNRTRIRGTQTLVKDLVEQLVQKGRAEYLMSPARHTLFLYTAKDKVFPYLTTEEPREAFMLNLADLLKEKGNRVRLCRGQDDPDCSKWFLARSKKQIYCTPRCQSRDNMRRRRGTPKERFGKRGRPAKVKTKQEGQFQLPGKEHVMASRDRGILQRKG
jgi:hypothetical protein